MEEMLGDKPYLQYRNNEMSNATNIRMSFLGYFISINIAFYVAIHFLTGGAIWDFRDLKLFALFILIFINMSVYHIYMRVESLVEKARDELFNYLKGNLSDILRGSKEQRDKEYSEDKDKRGVKNTIKSVLTLFSSIPIYTGEEEKVRGKR